MRARQERAFSLLVSLALCGTISGCATSVEQNTIQLASNSLLLVDTGSSTRAPIPVANIQGKPLKPGSFQLTGTQIDNPSRQDNLRGAALGAISGALIGGLLNGKESLLGSIGAGAGFSAGGVERAVLGDPERLKMFHVLLQEGYIPVNFWSATQPPVRVRILIYSTPNGATLAINGLPTKFVTASDLYMVPEDIQASTLQLTGYTPCRVVDSIVPGLQQVDGGEAVTARCSLVPLAPLPRARNRPKHALIHEPAYRLD